jgi:bifunctional enzyme CysN/CysC
VDRLELNDIGRVQITTGQPLFFDPYQLNRETGSFILVDPTTHTTVAAGMIRGEVQDEELPGDRDEPAVSPDVVWEDWNVPLAEREERNGHRAAVVWFTGLSGSGKSTIAKRVERRLFEMGAHTMLLDGDQVRHGLSGDLGFSPGDREENIRRIGEVANLFFRQGSVVLCTFVSPFREDRRRARALIADGRFVEVFVDTPLEVCEKRDEKGLYARARSGEIPNLTGIGSPYQPPEDPELRLDTVDRDPDELVDEVIGHLRRLGAVPGATPDSDG